MSDVVRLLFLTSTVLLATFVEKKYVVNIIPNLYEKSTLVPFLPRIYGSVFLVLSISSWWLFTYGLFTVGAKRKLYRELAEKDGEKDATERYSIPNLYVSGDSKHAKAFNCVQRSHQQALETFTQMVFCAIVAALSFPACTFLSTTLWFVGRVVWSDGYAESGGDASKRYSHPMAHFVWYGLIWNMLMAMMACVNFVARKDLMW